MKSKKIVPIHRKGAKQHSGNQNNLEIPLRLRALAVINKIGLFLFLIVSFPVLVSAQNNLGDEQINVVKPYQPSLSDAYKISEVPQKDTLTPSAPLFDYSITPKRLNSTFDVTPIKPVKRGEDAKIIPNKNYVKGGIGNYLTTYLEGFASLVENKNYSAGLRLKHLSSQGKVKDFGFSGRSNNEVSLFGTKYLPKSSLHGDIDFSRDVVHYYGFKQDTTFVAPANKEIKQRFRNLNTSVRWDSRNNEGKSFQYTTGFVFNNLAELKNRNVFKDYEITESNYIVDGEARRQFGKFMYGFKGLFDYNRNKTNIGNTGQAIVTLNPKVIKQGKIWQMTTGTNLTFQPKKNVNNQLKWRPRMYSDVEFTITAFENILSFFGGIGGGVIKNNFKNLTDENPFLSSIAPLNYSDKKLELILGAKGAFSKQTTWMARGSFATIDDMPFFVNDWNTGLNNRFTVVYDNVEVLNIHGEVAHKQSERLNIFFKGDYFHYATNIAKPWHKPSLELVLSAEYDLGKISFLRFLDKGNFFLRGDVFFAGKRFGQQIINDPVNSFIFVPHELKPYADVNLALNYRYNEKLSFFINGNNLAFSRYQRWMNFPSQKLNLLLGAGYSF